MTAMELIYEKRNNPVAMKKLNLNPTNDFTQTNNAKIILTLDQMLLVRGGSKNGADDPSEIQ